MRRQPTPEEFDRIMAILEVVTATTKEVTWHGTKSLGRELCKSLSGYSPSKGYCHACELKVVNILRDAVGLPPLTAPVSEGTAGERMGICRGCPVYHSSTRSCGRLGLDVLKRKEVTIGGVTFAPCGCFLPLKVHMKDTSCPAGKW